MPQSPSPQIVNKVKKLAEIAEGLRQGKDFQVTRLTTIKSLCGEPEAAAAFALFLAQRIQSKMRQEQSPKRYRELVDRAVKELKPYLTDPTEERKARLSSLCREMEAEQNEYKKIGWDMVRMLKSRDLVVVEESLKSVLRGHEAPIWAYQAAKDYAERYDARYGSGLIPSSAPMVEEIAGFWRKYYRDQGMRLYPGPEDASAFHELALESDSMVMAATGHALRNPGTSPNRRHRQNPSGSSTAHNATTAAVGIKTDPHVVKLGNGNVGALRDKQSRREGEGKS